MIGTNLKELRESKGLGLNELSRAAGINASYISAMERGEKTNPSTNTLKKIANALGVSVDELLKTEANEKNNAPGESIDKNGNDDEFDEEIRAIARNMKNLSEDKRRILRDLVNTMSEEANKALKK